jgi:hypothetical protein
MPMTWKRFVCAGAGAAVFVAVFAAAAVTPTQQQVLVDPSGQVGDQAGVDVGVDGDTAILAEVHQVGSGAQALVFRRSGTTWTLEQRLAVVDASATGVGGQGVAVFGNTAFVGTPGGGQGAVYVFTRSGTTWTQGQKLVASDGKAGDYFGYAIALDADTAVIGAVDTGAYVFTRSGQTWSQQQQLRPLGQTPGDASGFTVALSGDTAAIGAVFASGPGNEVNAGAVHVFTRSGTTWSLQQRLVPDDLQAGQELGKVVALDGDTLVAGAYAADASKGAGYVFTRSGTTWTQQARVVADDRDTPAAGGNFGYSAAVRGDTAFFGSRLHGSQTGAEYVYTRNGTAWTQLTMLLPSFGGTGSSFGAAVAFDGTTALIGAPSNDTVHGAGYAFVGFGPSVPPPPPPIETFFLPKSVVAKQNAKTPAKSTLVASGYFDTGLADVDLTKSATLDVGGFSFAIPSMTLKGTTYSYAAPGVAFSVKTNPTKSSRATFTLKAVADLTGKIAADGELTMRFSGGDVTDAQAKVLLKSGKYALGKVRGALVAPNLYVASCNALVKGGGKDALTVVAGLATSGTTPAAAADLTIRFGPTYVATIPAASFVKKGDRFTFTGPAGGVTSATLDYAKETITVKAKNVDLGAFADGPGPVEVAVALGSDSRAVTVRMVRKKTSLKY